MRGFSSPGGIPLMLIRRNALFVVALLALGLAGVALGGVTSGSSHRAKATTINVSVTDGKMTLATKSLPAGKVILVVANKGKQTHGLAIQGTGFALKKTPVIAVGKTATLTVTLKAGQYFVWDPIHSSMTNSKALTVKDATAGTLPSAGGATTTTSSSGGGHLDPNYDDGHGT
jgi:hypothetical protein